jgi:hypothetical protein
MSGYHHPRHLPTGFAEALNSVHRVRSNKRRPSLKNGWREEDLGIDESKRMQGRENGIENKEQGHKSAGTIHALQEFEVEVKTRQKQEDDIIKAQEENNIIKAQALYRGKRARQQASQLRKRQEEEALEVALVRAQAEFIASKALQAQVEFIANMHPLDDSPGQLQLPQLQFSSREQENDATGESDDSSQDDNNDVDNHREGLRVGQEGGEEDDEEEEDEDDDEDRDTTAEGCAISSNVKPRNATSTKTAAQRMGALIASLFIDPSLQRPKVASPPPPTTPRITEHNYPPSLSIDNYASDTGEVVGRWETQMPSYKSDYSPPYISHLYAPPPMAPDTVSLEKRRQAYASDNKLPYKSDSLPLYDSLPQFNSHHYPPPQSSDYYGSDTKVSDNSDDSSPYNSHHASEEEVCPRTQVACVSSQVPLPFYFKRTYSTMFTLHK